MVHACEARSKSSAAAKKFITNPASRYEPILFIASRYWPFSLQRLHRVQAPSISLPPMKVPQAFFMPARLFLTAERPSKWFIARCTVNGFTNTQVQLRLCAGLCHSYANANVSANAPRIDVRCIRSCRRHERRDRAPTECTCEWRCRSSAAGIAHDIAQWVFSRTSGFSGLGHGRIGGLKARVCCVIPGRNGRAQTVCQTNQW